MRAVFAIVTLAALTTPAYALQAPPGYVPATIIGRAPKGSHAMEAVARRQDCGRTISVLVERDGTWQRASGKIVCK